jgi:hypothetical protein
MTWTELINRLLTIQKANGYSPQWVIDRIEEAGHPPKAIWRDIARALNFTQFWADNWKWLPGQETDEPDLTAIEWEQYPPPAPIPKPLLREASSPVTVIKKGDNH